MFGDLAFGWYDINFGLPTPPAFNGEPKITGITLAARMLATGTMGGRMAGSATDSPRLVGAGELG